MNFNTSLYKGFSKASNTLNRIEDRINRTTRITLFIFVLILFGIAMLILNIKTPLIQDDFNYSFGLNGRISSFIDILQFQYFHYFAWGGRCVVHTIAQTLLAIDPLLADILNSTMYVVYSLLIYYHAIGNSKKNSFFVLVIIFCLTFILQPSFGNTYLWLTGSANYLWGTSIVLMFLLPYRRYLGNNTKYGVLKAITMFIMGILTGWTNENTGAALIVVIFLFLVYYKRNKIKIPLWAIGGIVGCIIGYLFLILAPGNIERVKVMNLSDSINAISIVKSCIFFTLQLAENLGVINLLLIISLASIIKANKTTNNDKTISLVLIYFIGTLVSLYVMLGSPFFPNRSWFPVITFNIIAFAIGLHHVDFSNTYMKWIRRSAFLFVGLITVKAFYVANFEVSKVKERWDQRTEVIMNSKKTGEVCIFKVRKDQDPYIIGDTEFLGPQISRYYDANIIFELDTTKDTEL